MERHTVFAKSQCSSDVMCVTELISYWATKCAIFDKLTYISSFHWLWLYVQAMKLWQSYLLFVNSMGVDNRFYHLILSETMSKSSDLPIQISEAYAILHI
jgi:hypothetical protein